MDQPMEVGPYRVLRPLGEGGMAQTFVAERTGPGGFVQRVCLKRVRRGLEQDAEFVRQFMAEARIMATLRHATVVQVLDFGEDSGAYYLALELVEGMDLRQLLDAVGQLDPATVLHLAVQLTTALDIAHRSKVVHRDVSPSNVLLSAEGEVRLTDFGIARALGDDRHTRTGVVKGKYPYMAPEYVGTGLLDARSDLFALGVVLYECLAGRRPYDGATEMETLARAATGAFTPLQQALGRTTPMPDGEARLFASVEQLLSPDPDARPASSAELLETLTALPADGQATSKLAAQVRARRAAPTTAAGSPAVVASDDADRHGEDDSERGAAAGDTAPLPRGTGALTEDEAPRPGRRRAWAAVVAIGLGAGVAGGLLALPEPPPPGAPSTARPPPITSAAMPAAEPGPAPPTTPPADAGADAATPQPEPSAPATLTVVVIPYGEVSIDGRSRGKAPVRARLRPGPHRIVAHLPGRTERRQVTLRPGGARRLVIR